MPGKLMTQTGEIAQLLRDSRRVAVLGASAKPNRPSHQIFRYLLAQGYDAIPVNPAGGEIAGIPVARQLADISGGVDIVDVFRNPRDLDLALVDQCLDLGARTLWLQDGVVRQDIADRAVSAGLQVVMDDCILRRHRALLAG